jgi:dihydropteroate synthase
VKNTFFCKKNSINVHGNILSLELPLVMGILNATPDSFYDGKINNTFDEIIKHASQMVEDGATIIDIGGYSTRPSASDVSIIEELKRVIPVIEKLKTLYPNIIISIDTFRAEVAREAINNGASIINDISAGELDHKMFETVADLNVPYIMMHTRGTPQTMQSLTQYENLIGEIISYFSIKINTLKSLGVNDLIIDPGFGFAKTMEQNYELLQKLPYFKVLELPILVGVSRKSMIYKLLNISPDESLNGTTTLNTIALMQGASIIRVHDVKEAVETVKLLEKVNSFQ